MSNELRIGQKPILAGMQGGSSDIMHIHKRAIGEYTNKFGAMAQLVARPPPERKVGSSILSGLTIFLQVSLFEFWNLNLLANDLTVTQNLNQNRIYNLT